MINILAVISNHDDFTKQAFDAAQKILPLLNNPNIKVTVLSEKNATKQKVDSALSNNAINLLIHYGHGDTDALYGQADHGNKKEKIIDINSAKQLLKTKGVSVSTVSCNSAAQLGPASIDPGTNAYIGYKEEIAFPGKKSSFLAKFIDAFNKPIEELLKGAKFQEAFDRGKETYLAKIKEIEETDDPQIDQREQQWALIYMNNNYRAFALVGNGGAQVIP